MESSELTLENHKSGTSFALKGIFRIGGQRNFSLSLNEHNFLVRCNRFWSKKDVALKVSEKGVHLLEVFEVDDKISRSNGYIHVEFIKIGNKLNQEILGLMRLPLEQFRATYYNSFASNGVCSKEVKTLLPLLSINSWLPVVNLATEKVVGEIECLLGIGTDKQIENLKASKNWESDDHIYGKRMNNFVVDGVSQNKLVNENTSNMDRRIEQEMQPFTMRYTEDKSFRFFIEIESAKFPSLNQSLTTKKKNRYTRSSPETHTDRWTGDEPNGLYVTFQAMDGHGYLVKSYEGMVFSTDVKKSFNPKWKKMFYIFLSPEYLISKNGKFIFKVWKSSNTNLHHHQLLPNPMKDSVIGVSTINFKTFPFNTSFRSDWFDIIDINNDVKGQIKIIIRPVDDLKQLVNKTIDKCDNKNENQQQINISMNADSDNLHINQVIRNKFNELEQISLRLKSRLLDVTKSIEYASIDDDSQLDEFERDINIPPYEDDQSDFFSSLTNNSPSKSETNVMK